MSEREPTDTTLATIMAADQEDAATQDLAMRIAHFYITVAASGMPKKSAARITEAFAAMATGTHFGIDVADPLGINAMLDMED